MLRQSSLTSLSLACLLAGAPQFAKAAINDAYVWSGSGTPASPQTGPNGTTWPEGWEGITITADPGYEVILGAHQSVYLGLENVYQGPDWTKDVTLKLKYQYGEPSDLGIMLDLTAAGYPNGMPDTRWDELTVIHAGAIYTVNGQIKPQSAWEWIGITNNTNFIIDFHVTSFTSVCTPAPGALGLLGLAAVIGHRHGRRRRP